MFQWITAAGNENPQSLGTLFDLLDGPASLTYFIFANHLLSTKRFSLEVKTSYFVC